MTQPNRGLDWLLWCLVVLQLVAGGCASSPIQQPKVEQRKAGEPVGRHLPSVRRSAEYVVVIAAPSDTYESLAGQHLGDLHLGDVVADFNENAPITAGDMVAIPLCPVSPGGIDRKGYQTVPILCYHEFTTSKSTTKTSVTREMFDLQMAYLKKNNYHVISLHEFFAFLEYRLRPPSRSVVITMDDGYDNQKSIAVPVLKKYGFTATLFINTANISGQGDSTYLRWEDLREFVRDGFEIEPHGVSHRDLSKLSNEELAQELRESRRLIREKLGVGADILAYPYGVFTGRIIKAMKEAGYRGGVTVIRGGNPCFTNAYSVKRSMIYNTDTVETFKRSLETYREE